MKMVFAALYDLRDLRRGSGTFYFLSRELERQGHELTCIAISTTPKPIPTRLLARLARELGKRYRGHQDPWIGRRMGATLGKKLTDGPPFDVFLTNDPALAAYTPTRQPVVLYTDAMFPPRYRDNPHPQLQNLSLASVLACQRVHTDALRRVDRACFASHWAAEAAAGYGVADSERIVVIPFGANLEPPTGELGERRCQRWRSAPASPLELLFVGIDWQRKGGEIAVAARQELARRGLTARLHIVGADLPGHLDAEGMVQHGHLDKTDPLQKEKLTELYARCDLLLLPSRAEGYGIVFAEAAAYSLPSLACRTTGVETAVADGESGVLLALNADAGSFADVIESWYRAPERYRRLVRGARRHYETTVNWPTAVTRLSREIEAVL